MSRDSSIGGIVFAYAAATEIAVGCKGVRSSRGKGKSMESMPSAKEGLLQMWGCNGWRAEARFLGLASWNDDIMDQFVWTLCLPTGAWPLYEIKGPLDIDSLILNPCNVIGDHQAEVVTCNL